jgi:uracil-DNA glycosylase
MIRLKIVEEKEKITNDWSVEKLVSLYVPLTWESVFESAKNELKDVSDILEEDRPNGRRVPDNCDLFRIFNLVPLHKVRVVILGQDPFYSLLANGKPQATGIAFSVPREAPIPPSLKNIYKVLKATIPTFNIPNHGDLTNWVLQGVFLLNACLTTRLGEANVYKEIWSGFIKKVITAILDANPNVIFLLWGKEAQKFKKMIGGRATILETSHPSPLGFHAGFGKSNNFNEVNDILIKQKKEPIDWNLI